MVAVDSSVPSVGEMNVVVLIVCSRCLWGAAESFDLSDLQTAHLEHGHCFRLVGVVSLTLNVPGVFAVAARWDGPFCLVLSEPSSPLEQMWDDLLGLVFVL